MRVVEKLDLVGSWREIEYLKPIYDEHGGNCTEVGLSNGERIVDMRKTKTVLNELVGVFAMSVSLVQRNYGGILGRKSSSPIPLAENVTLLPLKMRSPLAKDDGALGYVVKSRIKKTMPADLDKNSRTTLLFLKSGAEILVMAHSTGIERLIYDSEKTEQSFINLMRSVESRVFEQTIQYQLACPCQHCARFQGHCPKSKPQP